MCDDKGLKAERLGRGQSSNFSVYKRAPDAGSVAEAAKMHGEKKRTKTQSRESV